MPIRLTRELAYAAGTDAGDKAMRAVGRSAWSEDDYSAAAKEFSRLWSLCKHGVNPQECRFCGEEACASV